MDTLKAIFSRRSIRTYTDESIPDEIVETLIKTAGVAPSAMDERPWHFVVIKDRDTLRDMAARMENCDMFKTATLGLLICGDRRLEKFEGLEFWVQDCSACVQNVHLAAHALGLGSVWVAIHPLEDRTTVVREALDLPQEVIPFAILSMGYPAEQLEGEDRYDAARVHCERW